MGAILHKIYKYIYRNDRMENFLTKPHISDPIRHPVSSKSFSSCGILSLLNAYICRCDENEANGKGCLGS